MGCMWRVGVVNKGGRLTSGHIIVVMIEAGTIMPPIPRPAMIRMPQSWYRLSGRPIDMAPQPERMLAFCSCSRLKGYADLLS